MQGDQTIVNKNPKVTLSRRLPLFLLLGGVLLLLLWVGAKGWRIYRLTQSLQTQQAQAEALLAGGISTLNPEEMSELTLGVRRDVVALKQEVAPLMPLSPYLTWLPKVGSIMPSAPHLLELADAGTETAAHLTIAFQPALDVLKDDTFQGSHKLPQLLAVLNQAQPSLYQIEQSLNRLSIARRNLDNLEGMPEQVQTVVAQMDKLLPLGQAGLRIAPALPALLGAETPKNYLIIAQNEDEIRPTGGFISGAGVVTLENGRITSLSFSDAYQVDNYLAKPYDFPPQPLYDFMGSELFLFRDSNFWPDFPTSAEQAIQLYTYGQEVPLDGVIAIDQIFLEMLLTAIEPVYIPELDAKVTRSNVREIIRGAWSEGEVGENWLETRKSFMGPIAFGVRTKLESDLGSLDPVLLVQAIKTALDKKHLQIYLRDPQVAAVLAELDWDGRVRNDPNQDILMVVDTNLGFNKSNAVVQNSINYFVTLNPNGSALVDLKLNYQHTGNPTDEPCTPQLPTYQRGLSYSAIINQCYWDYVRVYAPTGSQLISATVHPVAGEFFVTRRDWPGIAKTIVDGTNLTIFSNLFLLEQGTEIESGFQYQLPVKTVQQTAEGDFEYQLQLYKQAGQSAVPTQITLKLPPKTQFLSSDPPAAAVEGQTIRFSTQLDQNLSFLVRYRSFE